MPYEDKIRPRKAAKNGGLVRIKMAALREALKIEALQEAKKRPYKEA